MVLKELKFFFDPVSPYSYLGSQMFNRVVKKYKNTHVTCVPVLFTGLLNAHGQRGGAEIASKRSYIFLDCFRMGQLHNIPFVMPPAHPFNPLLSLRVLTAVYDPSKQFTFAKSIMYACWGKGLDITTKDVIIECARMSGLNGEHLLELAESDTIKNKLKENTDAAVAAGVFGVPTVIINNEMFWGSDRMEHLDRYLDGELLIDPIKIKKLIEIPRGSDRKSYRQTHASKPSHVNNTH